MSPAFPYPYTIRISTRAKRIRARIRPGLGLEFVLPKAVAHTPVATILERFKPWVEQHYQAIMGSGHLTDNGVADFPRGMFLQGGKEYVSFFSALPDRKALESLATQLLPPHALSLQTSLTESLLQNNNRGETAGVALRRIPFALAVAPREPADFLTAAKNWLRAEARRILEPKLLSLATELGVCPKEIRIHHTRTRWGSCSVKGNINLALSLVFLPPNLARYVLVHELCHLKEMNHSPAFWKEVLALEPDGLELDRRLRAGWRYVPTWL